MAAAASSLDPDALRRLGRALSSAGAHARQLRVDDLVALAPSLPPGGRLRVDLRAARVLGYPLVVLEVGAPAAELSALSAREREVVALVAAGCRNREIAARLCVTTATVKDHVHHALRKTGLPNRAALGAAWAAAR